MLKLEDSLEKTLKNLIKAVNNLLDNGVITNDNIVANNIVTSFDVTNIIALTQVEYDALVTKVATTLYVILEV